MNKSRLAARSLFRYGMLLAVALLVLMFISHRILASYSIDAASRDGQIRLRMLAELLDIQTVPLRIETKSAERWFGRQNRQGESGYFRLINESGRAVVPHADSDLALDDEEFQEARKSGVGERIQRENPSTLYVARAIEREGQVVGYLHAAIPLRELEESRAQAERYLFGGFVLVFGAGLVVLFVLTRRLAQPYEELRSFAGALVDGDYDLKAPNWDDADLSDVGQGLEALGRELTKRIQTGAQGQKSLETILASMVEGLVAVDRDQKVLLINDQARGLLGLRNDHATPKKLNELTRSVDLREGIDEAINQNRNVQKEIQPVGGHTILSVHIAPLRDDEREVQGAVCVIHDVTRVRRLENMRRDFVANVSHELKTPLTAFQGAVETILDDPKMPDEVRTRFVQRALDNAQRLHALINDVLELSRIQSSRDLMEDVPLDFGAIVRESISHLASSAERKDLSLRVDLEEERIKIRGDRRSLRSVVDNLVTNAINYSPEQGTLTVSLRRDGDDAELVVADTGIGIAKDQQERVFERFYRVDGARSRSQGGTGLGLAIVKNCVLAHRGTIAVESELGKGSTFRVRFPITD